MRERCWSERGRMVKKGKRDSEIRERVTARGVGERGRKMREVQVPSRSKQ